MFLGFGTTMFLRQEKLETRLTSPGPQAARNGIYPTIFTSLWDFLPDES